MQNSEMKSNRLLKNPLLTKVFALFIMIVLLQIPLYMVGILFEKEGICMRRLLPRLEMNGERNKELQLLF